jgi:PEP-CTERM motif
MRKLRAWVCLALLSILGAALANANTLHGYCVAPAGPCTDNGTITPTNDNPPTFAFSYSGNLNNGHGDFWLIQLVPDNHNTGFSLTLNAANTANPTVAGSLFSSTPWNSGKLSAYMSPAWSFGGPSHPLSAFLPSTEGVDPGANGYFVYLYDFGAFDYKTASGDPAFSVGSGSVPQGSAFLAVLTAHNSLNVAVDTPNSGSILEADGPAPVPEPSSFLLLGSGIFGCVGMMRRKVKI